MQGDFKFFVLGAGSMGSLVTHEIAKKYPQSISTLLLRNQARVDLFNSYGSTLKITKPQEESITTTKHIARSSGPKNSHGNIDIIHNLLLSPKTYQTESAIEKYLPYLNSDSSILLLQNGMGMVERLRERFWPNGKKRPSFYQAVSTHGSYSRRLGDVVHVGLGGLTISKIPENLNDAASIIRESESFSTEVYPDFIKAILETGKLNAIGVPYVTFLMKEMEKLVANACINPLTAILDCFNGDLLEGSDTVKLMKRIISEAVAVFNAEYQLLKEIPFSNNTLNNERLLFSVLEVCKLTEKNSSSMREDIKSLNNTEVDWINGYIVALGIKHKIPTPTNKSFVSMVKNKLSIERSIEKRSSRTGI